MRTTISLIVAAILIGVPAAIAQTTGTFKQRRRRSGHAREQVRPSWEKFDRAIWRNRTGPEQGSGHARQQIGTAGAKTVKEPARRVIRDQSRALPRNSGSARSRPTAIVR
jgi:hypothetical protein